MTQSKRRSRKLGWRFVVLAVAVLVVLMAVVRNYWMDVYYIPSGSMEPLLNTGDRVVVTHLGFDADSLQRGDVVVFDGRGSFTSLNSGKGEILDAITAAGQWLRLVPDNNIYVKRVIGLPGDKVKCCSTTGQIQVNGQSVSESYLYEGDAPSELNFEVTVPQGKLWLMGDHRSVSLDSRALLGSPGGGLISMDRVIAKPWATVWPLNRMHVLPSEVSASK